MDPAGLHTASDLVYWLRMALLESLQGSCVVRRWWWRGTRTWGGEILTHFEQQGDDIGDFLLELTAWVPVYLIFCFLLEGRA